VRDEKYGERVRVDAARSLLDRAGYLPPVRQTSTGDDKDPASMTSEELRDAIEKIEREIAERAQHVGSGSTVGSTAAASQAERDLAEFA
jgi:hypothetical protein